MEEELYLTKEQSLHLQELGLDMSDAEIFHIHEMVPRLYDGEPYEHAVWNTRFDYIHSLENQPNVIEFIPTYTLQEIFKKLPRKIRLKNPRKRPDNYIEYNAYLSFENHSIVYITDDGYGIAYFYFHIMDNIFLEPAYEALCWALENNVKE